MTDIKHEYTFFFRFSPSWTFQDVSFGDISALVFITRNKLCVVFTAVFTSSFPVSPPPLTDDVSCILVSDTRAAAVTFRVDCILFLINKDLGLNAINMNFSRVCDLCSCMTNSSDVCCFLLHTSTCNHSPLLLL